MGICQAGLSTQLISLHTLPELIWELETERITSAGTHNHSDWKNPYSGARREIEGTDICVDSAIGTLSFLFSNPVDCRYAQIWGTPVKSNIAALSVSCSSVLCKGEKNIQHWDALFGGPVQFGILLQKGDGV